MASRGCLRCRGFSSVLGSTINLIPVGVCRGDSFAKRMASSSRVEIEKFNGHNFETWKLKMEDLMVDKEQWAEVDPGTRPTSVSTEDWEIWIER